MAMSSANQATHTHSLARFPQNNPRNLLRMCPLTLQRWHGSSDRITTRVMHTIGPYSRPAALAKRDGRTREARLMRDTRAALTAHVGGTPSITQAMLIDRAVQLTIRIAAMDRKFAETEIQTDHDSRTYLAWTGSLSRLLRDLGMNAAPQPVKTIAQHLAEKAAARA